MTFPRFCRTSVADWVLAFAVLTMTVNTGFAAETAPVVANAEFTTRANSLPRKVTIASAVAAFRGSVAQRLALAQRLIDEAAITAKRKDANGGLDLVVLPEFAILRESGVTAEERAVEIEGRILESIGGKALEHRTWIIAPMTLREPDAPGKISNAAVLIDRTGKVAGIFRKVHPIVDPDGQFEGGVTPGDEYPVFQCDFGRLGIVICWDMGYEEAWDALAAGGAEIVALPSASPQTLQPAAQALRHRYHVLTSAPRDNASLFDPIGRTIAQVTRAPGMLVHEIDLAYAILHWSETLQEGRALRERFGAKVGGDYSSREDTGIFWSNDPQISIGSMVRELGLRELPSEIQRMEIARKAALARQRSDTAR